MKITVCIRCQSWRVYNHKLTEPEKRAVVLLNANTLLDVEFKNEICEVCRCGIGDEVSERMLKIFNDGKASN